MPRSPSQPTVQPNTCAALGAALLLEAAGEGIALSPRLCSRAGAALSLLGLHGGTRNRENDPGGGTDGTHRVTNQRRGKAGP